MFRSVGYDAKAKILELEFSNGGIYQYLDFESDVYDALMSASSLGRFFLHNIDGAYTYIKMR